MLFLPCPVIFVIKHYFKQVNVNLPQEQRFPSNLPCTPGRPLITPQFNIQNVTHNVLYIPGGGGGYSKYS